MHTQPLRQHGEHEKIVPLLVAGILFVVAPLAMQVLAVHPAAKRLFNKRNIPYLRRILSDSRNEPLIKPPSGMVAHVLPPGDRCRQVVGHAGTQEILVPGRRQLCLERHADRKFEHPAVGKRAAWFYALREGDLPIDFMRERKQA